MTQREIATTVRRLCSLAVQGAPAQTTAWWAGTSWPPIPAHPDPFTATPEGEARLTQIMEGR